ncbi:MAG: hypothetical protein V9G15_12985 [Dermatophilaceae bacterium]|nr:hypothetical protein [Actinomycetales bacterium]
MAGVSARSLRQHPGRHWHTIDQAGHWTTYVRAIARLFEQLHADLTPIDYEWRRISALPAALRAQAWRLLPNATRGEPPRFSASLWVQYTGGELQLAPAQLHEWNATDDPETGDVIESAATGLGKPTGEPLAWQPP